MTIELTTWLKQVAQQRNPVWVDGCAYGETLLNKGKPAPWDDVGALVSYIKQLQGLLKSDVLVIDIARFYEFWLNSNPNLLAAMGVKKRLGYALRTLLADQTARDQLHEVVMAICTSCSNTPIVLSMPSPKLWIGTAHAKAKNIDQVEVSWEDAESGAMYMADFLRIFSDCSLSGILIEDGGLAGPQHDTHIRSYQPIFNVANHYHWEVSLKGCAPSYTPAPELGVAVAISESNSDAQGQILASQCWRESVELPLAQDKFWYVIIPRDAVPEQVLEVLAKLREEP